MLYRHTTRPNTQRCRGLVVVSGGLLLVLVFFPLVVGFVVSSSQVPSRRRTSIRLSQFNEDSMNSNNISSNNNNSKTRMLLRLRSNFGTWKVTVPTTPAITAITLDAVLTDYFRNLHRSYTIVEPVSFDPQGTEPIPTTGTLAELGLQHGSMLYCRLTETTNNTQDRTDHPNLEEETDDTNEKKKKKKKSTHTTPSSAVAVSSSSSAPKRGSSRQQQKTRTTPPLVVDLLDSSSSSSSSSDDENENEEGHAVQPEIPLRANPRRRRRPSTTAASSSSSSGVTAEQAIVLLDDDDEEEEKEPATPPATGVPVRRSSTTAAATAAARKKPKRTTNTIPAGPFRIVSYNVWFGPPDPAAQQVHPQQRMEALVAAIVDPQQSSSTPPMLCMGFQELTRTLQAYLEPALSTIGYRLVVQRAVEQGAYGVGLALPKTVAGTTYSRPQFLPFRTTTMQRGMLYVHTDHVIFGTCHLESFTGKDADGARQREDQILEATQFLRAKLHTIPTLQVAILAGDFNWDDEITTKTGRSKTPPANTNLLALINRSTNRNSTSNATCWKDAGTANDYTYDSKLNPMLGGYYGLRRRFDRCIYLSKQTTESGHKLGTRTTSNNDVINNKTTPSSNLRYESTKLLKIGTQPIPNLVWNKKNFYKKTSRPVPVTPSDHYGIIVDMERIGN